MMWSRGRGTHLERGLDDLSVVWFRPGYGLTRSVVPARDLFAGVGPRTRPALGCALGLAPAEFSSVLPHPMQHNRHLAGQRDAGALEAARLCYAHGPGLQGRPARYPAEQRGGGLVERGSHHLIAAFADMPGAIDLA